MPSAALPADFDIFAYLHATMAKRIMMIDGAMGTMMCVLHACRDKPYHALLGPRGAHSHPRCPPHTPPHARSQKHRPTEEDYRGERFKDWPSLVKGNNDLLVRGSSCARIRNRTRARALLSLKIFPLLASLLSICRS